VGSDYYLTREQPCKTASSGKTTTISDSVPSWRYLALCPSYSKAPEIRPRVVKNSWSSLHMDLPVWVGSEWKPFRYKMDNNNVTCKCRVNKDFSLAMKYTANEKSLRKPLISSSQYI